MARTPARTTSPRTRGHRRTLALGSAMAAVPALLLAAAQPAASFGTVNHFGQNSEHERITRAALACAPGTPSDGSCFEPRSLNQLAGQSGSFGAIGAPDSDETMTAPAHCDNADFLAAPGYPRTREQATTALRECIDHLQKRFKEGVAAAGGTVDAQGRVVAAETGLDKDCTFTFGVPGRDKCEAVEGFGRALHGIQDFYSHSNWTDQSDPARPVGMDNVPGLNRSAPSPLLDLTAAAPPQPAAVPQDLSTGCYTLLFGCSKRIEHSVMNKDNGIIDAATGATSNPSTPRGKVAGNFDRAVRGAIVETRHQWADFRGSLINAYGAERGTRIACTLTHDDAARDCA